MWQIYFLLVVITAGSTYLNIYVYGQPASPVKMTTGCTINHPDLALSCADDQRIMIYGMHFAYHERTENKCQFEENDCLGDAIGTDFHDEVLQACEGNTQCNMDIETIYFDLCGSYVLVDYIIVEYQCVLDPYYVRLTSACRDCTLSLKCPSTYMIDVQSIHYGRDYRGSQCTYNSNEDCLYAAHDPLSETVLSSCQNSSECFVEDMPFMNPIPDSCGSGKTDYVLVKYVCKNTSFKSDFWSITRCSGASFEIELCQHQTVISLEDLVFHFSEFDTCSLLGCSKFGTEEAYEATKAACDDKRACTDLSVIMEDICDSYQGSDAMEITYTCTNDTTLYEISKCVGDEFSDVLCESQVEIVNAFYGDMGHLQHCNHVNMSRNDCRVNIKDYNETYFETIEEKCHGNSCEGLWAESQRDTFCSSPWNSYTDYVTIVYRCSGESTENPKYTSLSKVTSSKINTEITTNIILDSSTEKANTGSNLEVTSSKINAEITTNIVTDFSTEKANTGSNLGLLVGVPISVVVIVAVAIIIALYLLRKKHTPKPMEARNGTNGVSLTTENLYANSKLQTRETTATQEDANYVIHDDHKYGNLNNSGPLIYSLATGPVIFDKSVRDESDTDMIVYDNDNYTSVVNTNDFSRVKESKEEEGNDMIMYDNANYSSFTAPEDTQDVTVIEDNMKYAGYNTEQITDNKAFVQNCENGLDEMVLFDNQQYASMEGTLPRDEDIITENPNYEPWIQ